MKAIRWRESARNDVDDCTGWYAKQGGMALELRFVDALNSTIDLIREHPAAGSLRHAEEVQALPAPLRFFPVRGFNRHLIYYIDRPDHVEVIRVWNSALGLQALFDGDDERRDEQAGIEA